MADAWMRIVATALLSASPVAAGFADQPLLRPSQDIDVTYRSAPQDGRPIEQRVRWLAASQTMRIDPPAPGLHVIIDYVARRMSVVRDATRSVIDMAAPDSMAGAIGGTVAGGYVRRGQAQVAGRPCTEWQTRDIQSRAVLVCVTADGVLLRADSAGQVRVSAVSVQYVPQDPAAFRVPADYEHHKAGAGR